MKSINYVIASYAGSEHTSNNKLSPHVLNVQIIQLCTILDAKRAFGIENLIKTVTIVCPRPRVKPYDAYYNFSVWKKNLNAFGVKLSIVKYVGDNAFHSYDQWIQGYLAEPTHNYYLFMEDDYALWNAYSDIRLVTYYESVFPDGIGYLCERALDTCDYYHAAISNGLVSDKTFQTFKDPLARFYNLPSAPRIPQIRFSVLFLLNNVQIRDYADMYPVLFWDSPKKVIIDYSLCKDGKLYDRPHVIVPIQFLVYWCLENDDQI